VYGGVRSAIVETDAPTTLSAFATQRGFCPMTEILHVAIANEVLPVMRK